MAPMNCGRGGSLDEPTPVMVEYYRQRTGAGLIVTQDIRPSPAEEGYLRTPGIHSKA